MAIERITQINKCLATRSVRCILLAVIVLALPALGATQEVQALPGAPARAMP
jgi:hypothetical protein